MSFLSLPAIRQALACVALLGVCLAPIESLIPDAHDGDAVVTTNTSGGITDSSRLDGSAPAEESLPSGQQHAFHMDHCSHAHSLGLGPLRARDFGAGLELAPSDIVRSAPASVSIEPHQRPPIA